MSAQDKAPDDPFWKRRMVGLKRPRRVPSHRIFAARQDMLTVIDPDTGEMETRPVSDFSSMIAACIAGKIKLLITEHPAQSLLRFICDAGIAQALINDGYIIRPYESQRRTAGLVIARTDDVEDLGKEKVEIWDIGTYFPSAPKYKRGESSTAAGATARRWSQLCEFTEANYGTRPEMTPARLGSTAFRLNWDGVFWRKPKAARKHGRKTFHGGYTRAFLKGEPVRRAKQYDINSAYVWALKEGVPSGPPVWIDGPADETHKHLPGFYWAEVLLNPRSPGILIFSTPFTAPVPAHIAQEPTGFGQYLVWCTSQELALANEMGVVSRVFGGWVFPDGIGHDFDATATLFELARNAARDISPQMEAAAKLTQSSTWGGLARKPIVDEVVISGDRPGEGWFPYVASSGMLHGAWTRHKDIDADARQQIMIASWITATVRVKLVRTIMTIGQENVLYADTDCLIVRENITLPTGTAYGEWKLERVYSLWRAYGGKRYEGITVEGEKIIKAAGIGPEWFANGKELHDLYGLAPLAAPPDTVYSNKGNADASPPTNMRAVP